ncbi:hypothetical protein ACFPFX_29600 [Streptomyces mauvecolor]|uniref:Uncharacterized protein n=1 Tax=Streptomyces mauvecolor TaxID=58345 RepID=A0ABV9UW10_9ACTN
MREEKANQSSVDDCLGEDELVGFEEVEQPGADVVSMGDASYTKMLGRIYN